ncbi:hypothetical protein Unana1_03915 [Umbelopsis nana]
MFKIRSRRHTTPPPSTPPSRCNEAGLLDFPLLTNPTNIVESFSEELINHFDNKRDTMIADPITVQPIEEPQPCAEVAPPVLPKLPYKSTDLNLLPLDDVFQRFINGDDTPDLSAESRTSSVTSENAALDNAQDQSVTSDSKVSESSNLLRISSSYFRSKFKMFRTVKSMDSLKKPKSVDDTVPELPNSPVELMKGKFSLDAARSFKLSGLSQRKKSAAGSVSLQEALIPALPSPIDDPMQECHLTSVPSKASSTFSQSTTFSVPQYTSMPSQPTVSKSQSSGSIAQAPPVFANYPPKPLKYSPVEIKDDSELMIDYQRPKSHSLSKRISLPAVMMRRRSASQAVTIDNSALDMAEISKADRRKSDPNTLPVSGTFGRGSRLFQAFASGGDNKFRSYLATPQWDQ